MTKSSTLHLKKNGTEINSSFLEIVNQLEDGYFETDLSGNFSFVNAAVIRMFGYSQEELIGMNNRGYMDEQVAKKVYQIYNRVYKTGIAEKSIEYEIIKKDGETATVDVTLSLIKNEANETIGFRGGDKRCNLPEIYGTGIDTLSKPTGRNGGKADSGAN